MKHLYFNRNGGCRKSNFLFSFLHLALFCYFASNYVQYWFSMEWLRWASFNDGTKTLLFDWQSLWWVWVVILGDDRYCCFKGVGRWSQGWIIWSGMRRTKSMAFIPNCSLFLLKNSTTSQFEDRILASSAKVLFFSNPVHVFCYAMSIRRN